MEDSMRANPSKEPQTPREAFADRLRREREGANPEPMQESDAPEPLDDPEASDAGQPEPTLNPEGEDGAIQPDDEIVDADDGDQDIPEEYRQQFAELREKAEKAEEARASMERDYRRKTHKIAQARRELDDGVHEAAETVQYLAQRAQANMQKYAGVDWQQLQAADPAQFQQARQQYAMDLQVARQAEQEQQTVIERARQMRETARQREADLSKEILQSVIPEWGSDHYVRLRDYATEQLDMAPEEVDAITDWRTMRMIHQLWQGNQAPAKVTRRGPATSKPPRGAHNRPTGQARNARGQYIKAREAAQAEPGNREQVRGMFAAKLRAERER